MKPKIAAIILVLLGLLQMVGDLAKIPALKGIGAASNASPAPRVFSAAQGLETYSTDFYIEWRDKKSGEWQTVQFTPEVYQKIRGPYNRRNVYGAAMAYAPVLISNELTRPMLDSVTRYAFCGDAPLLRELGIDPNEVSMPLRIRLEPKNKSQLGEQLPLTIEVSCYE